MTDYKQDTNRDYVWIQLQCLQWHNDAKRLPVSALTQHEYDRWARRDAKVSVYTIQNEHHREQYNTFHTEPA